MEEQKHSAESPGKRCFSPQIKRILARLQVINVSVSLYLKCHHIAKLANFLSSKLSGEDSARRNGCFRRLCLKRHVNDAHKLMSRYFLGVCSGGD